MPEKPPAIESFKESTKSPESELSPEVLEKVMNKVQDINEAGVAYSFVSGGPYSAGSIFEQDNLQKTKLVRILKEGLLGTPEKCYLEGVPPTKEQWAKEAQVSLRKGGRSNVYFNVTGMAHEEETPNTQSGETWISKSAGSSKKNALAFIFDLSKFTYDDDTNKMSRKYYETYYKRSTRKFTTAYGFNLSHRVPPRFFNGILLKLQDNYQYDQLAAEIGILSEQVYKEKGNLLLPIYDVYGNLYWPKKMSYEEVKKFVEERDKNKE